MTPYRLPNPSPHSASGLWIWGLGLAEVIAFLVANVIATQYIAWKFRFHPNLGAPLFDARHGLHFWLIVTAAVLCLVASGEILRRGHRWRACTVVALGAAIASAAVMPVYAPWMLWVWGWHYWSTPGTADWWTRASDIFLVIHLAPVLSIGLQVARARQFGGETDLHGSARWATGDEIAQAGLLNNDGVYVGAWEDGGTVRYLRHDGPEHVLVVAPTRSGKGVGVVVPTLLSWPHSVVVNDIKGENWAVTAGWRRQMGRCIRCDPTCQDGSAARYNPLRDVRPWPNDARDVQLISHEIASLDGKQSDHWNRTSRSFLDGVMLHQLYAGQNKSLAGCYRRLTDPRMEQKMMLEVMLYTDHDPTGQYGWTDPETGAATRTHPVVSSAMRAVLNMSDRERSSVISSAISHFEMYADPIIAANTAESDFSLDDLVTGEPVSLYLVIPPPDLERLAPLLRLIFSMLTQRLTETLDPTRRVLFMVDEMPSLGELKTFASEMAWLAGYGIKCCLITQNLEQLSATYGEQNAIRGNCHIQVMYTPLKVETAEVMSRMLGERTVLKAQRTYTGGRFNPLLTHVIAGEQESKRPLLTPAEVLRMDSNRSVIFVGNTAPINGRKIRYYEDMEFSRRAAIPAPVQSDRAPARGHPWTHVAPLPGVGNPSPGEHVENLL